VTEITIGARVEQYLKLRDKKAEIAKRHKEELEPYNQALYALETLFQRAMDAQGLENLKTEAGTAYKSTVGSVSVADWDAFFEWVQENRAWHLVEKRPAKTAVEEVLEETGELPPGLDYSRTVKINVRKG
jgi:hypothetical protein